MRARDFLTENAEEQPTLYVDNPGGKWHEGEQSMSRESGKTEFGAPQRFGSVTASFSDAINLPVDMLADVRGMRGEQKNVRHDDLAYLVNLMKTTGKLPDGSRPGREYAPFITIDYSGTPWVSEGNHRIMAAKKLGWNYLPVEVRYFAGGETVKGPWNPHQLLALHKQLQGKPKFVAENRYAGQYKEIEFVCVNPKFANASVPQNQQKLYDALKQIPGVLPLRQDWDEGQISLTAIYKDSKLRSIIRKTAEQFGIQIDIEAPVSDNYVDRVIHREHQGQI